MKHSLLAAASLSLLAMLPVACSKSGTTAEAPEATVDTTLHISEIDMSVLNATRSYTISDTAFADSAYLTISAAVQWPKVIGKHDIKVFQDSIRTACFGYAANTDVQEAMLDFVADYGLAGFEPSVKFTPFDRVVPPSPTSYAISLDGRVLDYGTRLVTYQADKTSYLGGAHPNSRSSIFTYDLDNSRVITVADIIQPDKMPLFAIGVKKALAEQTELSIAELNQNLQVREFYVSDDIFIIDGLIYVHYNAYELLPYSFGPVNVEINPYEFSSLLTPYGRQLLLD